MGVWARCARTRVARTWVCVSGSLARCARTLVCVSGSLG